MAKTGIEESPLLQGALDFKDQHLCGLLTAQDYGHSSSVSVVRRALRLH